LGNCPKIQVFSFFLQNYCFFHSEINTRSTRKIKIVELFENKKKKDFDEEKIRLRI